MKKLEKHLDKNIRSISAKLSKYLQSDDAKSKIDVWNQDQLPRVEVIIKFPSFSKKKYIEHKIANLCRL